MRDNYTAFSTVTLNFIYEYNKICKLNLSSFKLFHNIIGSITKSFYNLEVVLNYFDLNFDGLVLTEIANDFDISLIDLHDYIFSFANLKKCDGIVLYLRNSYNFTSRIVEINQSEGTYLSISIKKKAK